jgi:4a-hydroxytetrahydrobiopterin dehydratase
MSESVQHHPRMTNEYNKVDIELFTHDAGNMVTEKDHMLAREIDRIYLPFSGKKSGPQL